MILSNKCRKLTTLFPAFWIKCLEFSALYNKYQEFTAFFFYFKLPIYISVTHAYITCGLYSSTIYQKFLILTNLQVISVYLVFITKKLKIGPYGRFSVIEICIQLNNLVLTIQQKGSSSLTSTKQTLRPHMFQRGEKRKHQSTS